MLLYLDFMLHRVSTPQRHNCFGLDTRLKCGTGEIGAQFFPFSLFNSQWQMQKENGITISPVPHFSLVSKPNQSKYNGTQVFGTHVFGCPHGIILQSGLPLGNLSCLDDLFGQMGHLWVAFLVKR